MTSNLLQKSWSISAFQYHFQVSPILIYKLDYRSVRPDVVQKIPAKSDWIFQSALF